MSEIRVDTISEKTSANGVAVDGLTIKDGGIKGTGAQSLVIGSTDGTSARLVLDATNGDASGGDFPVITADGTSLNITANNSGGNAFITFQCNSGEDVRIGPNGKVGIGESVPLGRLHVKTADSGGSATSTADELVVEGSGDTGIQILSGASSEAGIAFGDSGDSNIGLIGYDHANNRFRFKTNDAVQWYLDSSGNWLPAATDHGIYLGVTSATASNLLDDYEEGTFTPALSSTGATFAYTHQKGFYTKIGNAVTFSINFQLDGGGNSFSANAVEITGLPFTSANVSGQLYRFYIYGRAVNVSGTGATGIAGVLNINSTTIGILESGDNTLGYQLLSNQLSSSSGQLFVQGTYRV